MLGRIRWVRGPLLLGLVALGALGTGCGEAAPDEGVASHTGRLAHPGPWQIPAETLAIGDTQYVEYTGAGPWNNGASCAGGITTGGEILRQYLYDHFPQIASIGGYACRQNTANLSELSVHGTGRALDIMIPVVGADQDADNDAGDPVGNWLIENAEAIGIQYMIWDQWSWNASRAAGSKDRAYTGPNPHVDHLHVELSLAASQNTDDWFSGVVAPPAIPECDLVPAEGRIIDERDSCFAAYGPAQYWRSEEGVGYDGSLLWTNAYDSTDPSNWARWHLDFAVAGRYQLEVFVDPAFGIHKETTYAIAHAGLEDFVVIDQSQANGWVSLGEFDFNAGADQDVSVYDTSSMPPGDDQHIAVDALRLVPAGADPGNETGGTGGAPGSGGTGGAMGGSAGTPDPGTSGATVTLKGDSSCGCSTPGSAGNKSSTLALGFGLALLGWRRRRQA
ncbi:MAG: MYXO-CTERM sorting domain-containing protein [Polyangiaceae bacterium]